MAKINKGLKPVSVELRTSEITGIGIFALINFKKGNKIFDGVSIEEFNNLISWRNFHNYSRMVQKKILAFCVGTPNGAIVAAAVLLLLILVVSYENDRSAPTSAVGSAEAPASAPSEEVIPPSQKSFTSMIDSFTNKY